HHQHFRLRPRHEGGPAQGERPAVELLFAEDSHHRLAAQAPGGHVLELLEALGTGEFTLAIDEVQSVQSEGVLGADAGVDFGCVDAGAPEQVADAAPGFADAQPRAQAPLPISASCAAWCSVISAAISSSSASPAITLS